MTQSIQLATVNGVVSMIEKICDQVLKDGGKAPPGMKQAMDAVCDLLEAKGKHDKSVLSVVAKVRKVYESQEKANENK